MNFSELIAMIAAIIALGALLVAIYQLRISTLTMSSQLYMSAMESLSTRWLEFKKADQYGCKTDIKYHGSELLNRLEVVCLLCRMKAFRGKTAKDVNIWLNEQLETIQMYQSIRENFPDLVSSETTFDNILWFIESRKNKNMHSRMSNYFTDVSS